MEEEENEILISLVKKFWLIPLKGKGTLPGWDAVSWHHLAVGTRMPQKGKLVNPKWADVGVGSGTTQPREAFNANPAWERGRCHVRWAAGSVSAVSRLKR